MQGLLCGGLCDSETDRLELPTIIHSGHNSCIGEAGVQRPSWFTNVDLDPFSVTTNGIDGASMHPTRRMNRESPK